ncbi:uncharacterized protein LOC129572736 [Sitodiplosis mosellana]|uniref:uncharacterized protein LOC129572736 n=1 Tax=Sitodiplosis mosellana TaxID=263140 RepID=UPI00244400A7|nr:uncharacterized protein LOC129572736 [Sitodiplosis mosellana]
MSLKIAVLLFCACITWGAHAGQNGLPDDAYKIIIHAMRGFDVYGSTNGAWKLEYGKFQAERIPGIAGHFIEGQVTDKFFKGEYYIYMAKSIGDNRREYYALKDGERAAKKVNGLTDDVQLRAIHNLGGVIFYGSNNNGAFKLVQGELIAHRVPGISGPVRRIILGGSASPDDAIYLPN